ncbi:MAG TPA: polyketide synthase, partial [Pyrinomonadaceae bacterium]
MSNPDVHEPLEAIAIIGMSGRFPGAANLDAFWRNLSGGVESVSFFSEEELRASGVGPGLLHHPNYVKARAILDGVDLFDAPFFNFNPRETEITDPQHRLFLECAWESLEDAGYSSEGLEVPVAVYAGASWSSYLMDIYSRLSSSDSLDPFRMLLGNDKDHLPTWVSYKLNLKGLSVNVQTACSTSLVAVHLACQSLLTYQCDMALAGGATINVPQKSGYIYEEGGISSPDGHCRVFDEKARGSVNGSGVAAVVLKRLSEALEDGDTIHAVIKGSAVNNDGATKISYTAPSVDGQTEVIAMAQAVAGVEADTISMIEAHGSATAVGDPIEVAALTRAFRSAAGRARSVALGSVKSNVGHTGAAAGIAGLLKTVLSLKHRQIPPSLHFERPNPQIDFESGPFYVNTELTEWRTDGGPRRAGVSSFGIGG